MALLTFGEPSLLGLACIILACTKHHQQTGVYVATVFSTGYVLNKGGWLTVAKYYKVPSTPWTESYQGLHRGKHGGCQCQGGSPEDNKCYRKVTLRSSGWEGEGTVISGRAYGDCSGRLCGVAVLRGVAAVARKSCLELLRPQCQWCRPGRRMVPPQGMMSLSSAMQHRKVASLGY